MNAVLLVGWKFWKNRRFLTLLCDNNAIRAFPEKTYGISHPTANRLAKEPNQGDEARRKIFLRLITITTGGKESPALIKQATFCHQGIDIELFEGPTDNERYDIMRSIAGILGELFPDKTIEVRGILGQ